MNTWYVYLLSFKNRPFYIGVSKNPVERLYLHFKSNYGDLQKQLNKMQIAEVSINILETLKTDSLRVNKFCSTCEQYWIRKYLDAGHKLTNQVIRKQ